MSMFVPKSLAGGRYIVGDLIGHGGMAEVHIGTDTRLGRTVAIKIMRSDLAADAIFLTRFRREAHSVAQLNNTNIVSIYDSGEELLTDDNGSKVNVPYIVMEYIRGQTLRDILKINGALSQKDAEQIMLGMLSALEYSHRMGIIHRDIKPGNIMISEQGDVKVMDFGIARALDDSSATMTQNQGVVGTAQYLSPEQARGETVDIRSDLYSAGCVLYEMLTGKPPFTGDSAVAIAYQHVSEVATPPSTVMPSLPALWDSICAKAMAKDRTNRYSTAAEFRADITAAATGGTLVASAFNPLTDLSGIQARREEEATTALPTSQLANTAAFNPIQDSSSPSPTRAQQRAAEAKKKKKKRRIIIACIIGALALIALIIGLVVYNNSQKETVVVPTISTSMSAARAQEKIEAAGLTFVKKTDNNSTQPKGTFTKQSPAGGKTVAKGSKVYVWFSSGPKTGTIPDVSGMSQTAAKAALKASGFTVAGTSVEDSDSIDKNNVIRTDPAAGTAAEKGTSVTLYIASGTTTVPTGLVGQSKDSVLATLQAKGFSTTVETQYSSTVAEGNVISVSPSEGASITKGGTITVYVSQGVETVSLPSGVIGSSYSAAAQILQNSGFTVKTTGSTDSSATVSEMQYNGASVSSGTSVPKGSTITLVVTSSSSSSSSSSSPSSSSGSSGSSSSSGN